jgi:hypothetical protein
MTSDKKHEHSDKPGPAPPADDPERRGDDGRDGKAEDDRAAAEARLRALDFLRRMRRSNASDNPKE